MEGPPLGPGGEDITWPDQVAPRGRKASSTRKIKPQTSNLSAVGYAATRAALRYGVAQGWIQDETTCGSPEWAIQVYTPPRAWPFSIWAVLAIIWHQAPDGTPTGTVEEIAWDLHA